MAASPEAVQEPQERVLVITRVFDAPRALSLGTKMHHAAFTVGISQFGRSQLCRWADPADWERFARRSFAYLRQLGP